MDQVGTDVRGISAMKINSPSLDDLPFSEKIGILKRRVKYVSDHLVLTDYSAMLQAEVIVEFAVKSIKDFKLKESKKYSKE